MATGRKPIVILVVGMAGTGKTTLVHRLQLYTTEQKIKSYFINLDPAVQDVPYNCHVDVRDTVNYKEVMQQYHLGPNGAILTSLNLFATKIHQMIALIEKRQEELEWVIVDTPGQIEVFTWSASGQLITEAFSSTFPTAVLFVADVTRCVNPVSFMSTMMYSCSIMFKSQLPLLLALNKIDVERGDGIVRWMQDHDELSDALHEMRSSYSTTLTSSLAMFVHEYYSRLVVTQVSAMTGEGLDALRCGIAQLKTEYTEHFEPLLRRRAKERQDKEVENVERGCAQLFSDVKEE